MAGVYARLLLTSIGNPALTLLLDTSVRVEPLSPSVQIEHTNMVTKLRNLEQYYPALRATEYSDEIDRLFPLNRIEETFRRCARGPTLERSSYGTLIIPEAQSSAGVPISTPFTIQTSTNGRTF